ncbi:MAG: hypothetical protein HZA64_12705 [Rhodocyclales bacterium]|nr:hypothetical protein [Rhodocyclales bacterium]MBI5786307.1 hypothetical protein [Rhodocyclales bacterium]
MGKRRHWWCAALAAPFFLAGPAGAQPTAAPQERRELIYCADRMTPEEREAYRAGMRAARTLEEKQALRAAHRAEMQARAAAQGGAPCVGGGRQWRGGAGR